MIKQEHNSCLLVVTITVTLIQAACGIGSPNTAMTPLPTIDATFTPSKQITETLEPAGTMEPTFAYLATAQEATFNAHRIQVVETKQAISDLAKVHTQMCGFQLGGVFVSPNGKWIATDCRFDADSFRVFETSGNPVWEIPYSAIFEYYPDFLGSVRVLHWSADGNYLYFVNNACCPHTDTMSNGDALYRLNLQTGDWNLVIPGNFNYYSFSPTERHLVYILNDQANANDVVHVHVVDLVSEKEEIIDAGNFEQAGQAFWKHDGQQFALTAQTGNIYDENRRFSLIVLNLQNRVSRTIILDSAESLTLIDWSTDNILTIRTVKIMEYAGYYVNYFGTLYYDLNVDQFISLTPTP